MTLKEIQTAIDALSYDEIQELEHYLAQRKTDLQPGRGRTPEERIRLLHKAAAAIRGGWTQDELDEMTAAINEDYIEDVDLDIWRD
jgi:hypothetical protein